MSIFLKKNFIERMAVILIVLGIILGLLFLISTSIYFRSILLLIAIIIIIIVGFILMSYLSAKEENSPRIHMRRGMQYEDWRQYDKAIEEYNKVLAIDPNIQLAYKCLGDVHKKKEQFEKAIEICNKAIALGFAFIGTFETRGIAYMKKGQYDMAIEDLSKFLLESNINTDEAGEAYYHRGLAYMKKGRYDMAIEDFKIACESAYEDACSKLKDLLKTE